MSQPPSTPSFQPLPVPASRLGESPFWHPIERQLYWCDIPGRTLNAWSPSEARHRQWPLPTEAGSAAPILGGGVLLAMRDGLWRFDPASGQRQRLAPPPYDPAVERFNDGKADPQGRFWVGTIYEPRQPAAAALYRWADGRLDRVAGDVTVSNGLGWSPDAAWMYWTDTTTHCVRRMAFNAVLGTLEGGGVWQTFERRIPGTPLDLYGGRPDGAAVDAEGCYWVALFEGQRLLRISPDGIVLQDVSLPVRCPTMPCFGGDDLRTLYVTTAREGRSPEELQAQPLAGRVLAMRVEVPGLPVNFVQT